MNRREFLYEAQGALLFSAGAALPCSPAAEPVRLTGGPPPPLELSGGPQLFLDDYVVDHLEELKRVVQALERLARPVLDSKTFGVTQPYLTVVRDQGSKRFRIWYNHGPAVWHAVSEDGIRWADPRVAWDLPRSYGASLVDDGNRERDPNRRYKLASWQATRAREDKVGDDSGMWIGFSPDGFRWAAHDGNPVLPSWPEGYGKQVRHGVSDIVDVFYDPLAKRYAAALKLMALEEDGYARAPRAGKGFRRLVGMSTSKDFVAWEKPWRILTPDKQDDGLLEFYGMGGMHQRGSLSIGLVRVLRDDLACDQDGPKNGIGYTVLATSRDGIKWQRYREPFLDRNPQPGTWDHAMAWTSQAQPVGDEVFFYYGGYARGHKIAPTTERQIGLARMKRDRYVALTPTRDEGLLRTKPFLVPGDRLTLNANAARGEVRVRLLDPEGKPLQALGGPDGKPITGDVLAAEVRWPKPLGMLRGKAVRLEFRVRRASLYGFDYTNAG